MSILLAAVGGFFGAVSRYGTSLLFKRLGKSGTFATLFVNWLGSFLMGLTVHAAWLNPSWDAFLATGFLGAFTTFSTFMLDAVELMEKDMRGTSLLYMVITLIGGILLFMIGWNL